MRVEAAPMYDYGVSCDDVHRVVVTLRDGSRFEIVEQMTGGISITACSTLSDRIAIEPVAHNAVIARSGK